MTTQQPSVTRNEAAERLRRMWGMGQQRQELLDAALSEERRRTVERIRERLPVGFDVAYDGIESAVVWRHDLTVILDEIGGSR